MSKLRTSHDLNEKSFLFAHLLIRVGNLYKTGLQEILNKNFEIILYLFKDLMYFTSLYLPVQDYI